MERFINSNIYQPKQAIYRGIKNLFNLDEGWRYFNFDMKKNKIDFNFIFIKSLHLSSFNNTTV